MLQYIPGYSLFSPEKQTEQTLEPNFDPLSVTPRPDLAEASGETNSKRPLEVTPPAIENKSLRSEASSQVVSNLSFDQHCDSSSTMETKV